MFLGAIKINNFTEPWSEASNKAHIIRVKGCFFYHEINTCIQTFRLNNSIAACRGFGPHTVQIFILLTGSGPGSGCLWLFFCKRTRDTGIICTVWQHFPYKRKKMWTLHINLQTKFPVSGKGQLKEQGGLFVSKTLTLPSTSLWRG